MFSIGGCLMKPGGHSSSEIISILRADGWELFNAEGSHYQFKHPAKKGKVTVKHPDKDVPPKTFMSIIKQAGL
jgi:predicted RNA binding protein YcfA (HicA-like mRNA interferase family)